MKILNKFFKKPKVTFFCEYGGLENIEPIKPASEFIPEWFKKLKAFMTNMPKTVHSGTVKACPSFKDYFSTGYIIPLWCDLNVTITEKEFRWESPSEKWKFDIHPHEQYTNHLPNEAKDKIKLILKAYSPWRCITDNDHILMQQPLYYHYNDIFEVMPGIIWTGICYELNVQIIFKKYGEFFIPRGTPLCQYFIIKKEEIDFECISKQNFDMNKIYNKKAVYDHNTVEMIRTTFHNSYKESRKIK
jgi:hypothetical protein